MGGTLTDRGAKSEHIKLVGVQILARCTEDIGCQLSIKLHFSVGLELWSQSNKGIITDHITSKARGICVRVNTRRTYCGSCCLVPNT
jgi:hypothetical protein